MNVSIITACKNRNKPLSISLQSWLLFDEVKEVIIVDWSSDESISHLTKLDSRIKVITVPNKKYFNQPQPLNLAASIATGDFILKFDVDHVINPYWNFFQSYPIDENTFTSGSPNYKSPEYINENGASVIDYHNMALDQIIDYCNVHSEYHKSLYGMLYVTKDNFFKCGGFNEHLGEFYGFEDQELQIRFESLGLNHVKINYDHNLFHIPHPDSKRIEYFKGSDDEVVNNMRNNLAQYYSGNTLKYQLEYAISQYHTSRNKKYFSNPLSYYISPKTKWNIKKIDDQNYIATEMKKLENFPPVYYVTLEDSLDRQIQLESEFEQYEIIPKPIKSKRFSESDDIITGKYVYQLTGPTQGCIVSHLKAIKTWYESNESEYAFFCEDDLSLTTVEYWNFQWEEFIEKLPDDCECVQLMTIRGNFDGVYFKERQWDDWSQTAYIMNRDYAKKLVDNYCIGDTFNLEIKELNVMPIGENILFTNIGKVYTFPMFVENVEISTTDVNDLELEDGQKPNHIYSSEYVYHWWKNNGKNKTIDELMSNHPFKKSFVIVDEDNDIMKTELEQLLYEYSLDTENPERNFNIGLWYEREGHTAPALSYFLRCAERAEDDNFAYEALIRGSYCYAKQGTRDGSSKSMLQQALVLLPKRPEAYFLLSRFCEKREWWQDCYIYADQALNFCDFDYPKLHTDVEYPGKFGLLFEKSIASWFWGKSEQSRSILYEILENYSLSESEYNLVINNIEKMGGKLPKSEE
mgnify:CR=1 FL=1|tara:strand:+ start:6847 stop:9090 length:2244 start_codon:yes stop_codon:yes gene_type:complete